MTRLYMLDTNMVSYIVTGRSAGARSRLAGLSGDEVACVSAVCEAELLYGLAKSGAAEQRQRALNRFLARLKVHAWGREAAGVYGTLRARQELLGKMLGPLDTQIAAHAICLGATLVSRDKAFRHVLELSVENWATDPD